jgi:hypothetical protein
MIMKVKAETRAEGGRRASGKKNVMTEWYWGYHQQMANEFPDFVEEKLTFSVFCVNKSAIGLCSQQLSPVHSFVSSFAKNNITIGIFPSTHSSSKLLLKVFTS